jgi:hypothetical protein
MQGKELRGIVLEALYNQRRTDLVSFDKELGNLLVPDGALEGILRQLEKKDLIERPFKPLSGLGNGRITAHGIDVVEGTASPPFSILFHQHITTVQRSSDVQFGSGNIQNISDVKNIAIDHSRMRNPFSSYGAEPRRRYRRDN